MAGRTAFRRDWLSEHYVSRDQPKKPYATYAAAKESADKQNAVESPTHPFLPYKCGYCDAFHVGKSQPDDRRRGRR